MYCAERIKQEMACFLEIWVDDLGAFCPKNMTIKKSLSVIVSCCCLVANAALTEHRGIPVLWNPTHPSSQKGTFFCRMHLHLLGIEAHT